MTTDTTAPLTAIELDQLASRSGRPLPLHLTSPCHAKKPLLVRFWGDGVLEIRCNVCNKPILTAQLDEPTTARLNEQIACTDPSCAHPPTEHQLRLKPTCHPSSGCFVEYLPRMLVLEAIHVDARFEVRCGACRRVLYSLGVKL